MTTYSALKRKRDARKKRPRQHGSTLPRAVARRASDAPKKSQKSLRKTSVSRQNRKRKGLEASRRSSLRKVNPERQAKRRAAYRKKLAAYRQSETYKIVERRAGGRCECTVPHWSDSPMRVRCIHGRGLGDRLTHHHKTYARFGGAELPEDIIVLCRRCNDYVESQHPTRRRGRAA